VEISEKEFYSLEQNLYDLQMQIRDMEDIEVHRDELMQKLHSVKKQRDDFLQKGKMVEEERNEFVKSNKTLEQYLIEWKRKTQEFKQTNSSLKQRVSELRIFKAVSTCSFEQLISFFPRQSGQKNISWERKIKLRILTLYIIY